MSPRANPPLVRLRGVSKRFGALTAVAPLDLEIAAGDFLAILGPSGCGKTTLLRLIGGFVAPSTGTIEIAGADVTRLPPDRRPTNMVFQGYGLFPHMSLRQNVAYGLVIAKRPREEIDRRVGEALALVRLEELADRGIEQLSGGQQQRVALARALVMRPKLLLLDEPLAALDLKLRQAMQEELRRIHRETGGTFVFVTHDQGEALGLANRIAVMEQGRLVQEGGAEEIYARPRTRFVSTFIGEANLLHGRRSGGRIELGSAATFPDAGPDGPVEVVVRPEDVRLGAALVDGDLRLTGTVEDTVYLGAFVKYRVRLGDGSALAVHSTDRDPARRLAPGAVVDLGWPPAAHRLVTD
jgi:spermidine/putrescine transport system ATP-binding protein